jgi:hypothetical protein
MAILTELLDTAARYRHWCELQKSTKKSGNAEKSMQAARLRFSGLKQLNVDPGVSAPIQI